MASERGQTRPRRSALYMPGSNARAMEKARTLPCDVVILDLEDAVAPDNKIAARASVMAALAEGGFGAREVVVRVNGLDTPWGRDDLATFANAGADAVLVPKVSSAADVRAAYELLGGQTRLWVMIETCASLFRLGEIAAASKDTRLDLFVAGTNDLAKEMRARQDVERTSLQSGLFMMVVAARAHGLAVLDGVFNPLDDPEGLIGQCRQGADMGFDGKTLIHPSQIEAANAAFSPTADEIAWAQVVVNAFAAPEAASAGVLKVEGKMVELLHLEEAKRTLAIHKAITANASSLKEPVT